MRRHVWEKNVDPEGCGGLMPVLIRVIGVVVLIKGKKEPPRRAGPVMNGNRFCARARGVGIPDCIRNGMDAATGIVEYLRAPAA